MFEDLVKGLEVAVRNNWMTPALAQRVALDFMARQFKVRVVQATEQARKEDDKDERPGNGKKDKDGDKRKV